jgi:hypothetical protein
VLDIYVNEKMIPAETVPEMVRWIKGEWWRG